MNLNEQPLSADYKYRGRIINLRVDTALLPNGSSATREVVEHPGGVCVSALTEDGCLLFVRQFRYPYQKVLLELPAGKLDPGEDPLEAGKRELREETGAEAARYESCLLYTSRAIRLRGRPDSLRPAGGESAGGEGTVPLAKGNASTFCGGYIISASSSISRAFWYRGSKSVRGRGFSPRPSSMVKPGRPVSSMNQSLNPPAEASPDGLATV